MSERPPGVAPLLKALDEGWEQVKEGLDRHKGSDLRKPLPGSEWSVLDHLGHLATWVEICERYLPDIRAGRSPELGAAADWEKYNQEAIALKADWDAERVWNDAEAGHRRLREAVSRLQDDDLPRGAMVAGEPETVSSWVWAESAEHYLEHAQTLRGEP